MNNMKTIIRACLLAGLLLVSGNAFAQNSMTVKGIVKDSKGEPVIGAAVILEGTTNGVISDIDGKYSITFTPKSGKTPKLVYSSIGYVSQTIPAVESTINVTLLDDFEQLDEVVVVGYGAMKKSDITGSVTSVKVDETRASQSASIDQLLQGNAAGVQVVSNSAAPDAGVSVTIRGASSFNTSNQPLYVVDGVIMNTDGAISVGSHQGSENGIDEENNGLMGISPQDIESMEVLKDASATAIYGSQGANGVILITTKSARKEKPVITFSAGLSIANIYKKFDLMDPRDYMMYLDTKGINHTTSNYSVYTTGTEEGRYSWVDWQDYATRTSYTQRYYLTIAGRPKDTNYRFSMGYFGNQGVIKGTGYQNLTLRLNLDKTLGKLKFGTKTSLSYLNSQMTQGAGGTISQTPATSMVMSMLLTRPVRYMLAYDEEGSELDDDGAPQSGPDRWISDFQSTRTEVRVTPSLYVQYRILPWLTFKSTLGADYRSNERNKFKSYRINTQATGSSGAVAHVDRLNWNVDNLLLVNKKIGKHNISGTLGQSASRVYTRSQTVEGTNVLQWKGLVDSLNGAPYAWLTYGESHSQLMSFFGRAIYNYNNRYVLTATYRFDGSSKFAGKNKWARFPSCAFAWKINNEPWFNVPVVSSAKLRLGWGMVGNQGIPSNQTVYIYSTTTLATHDTDTHQNIAMISTNLPSRDLKWETTTQYNVGLDLGLFHGRLTLGADAYYKVTNDLLQRKTLPGSAGVSNPYVNMGSIENRGFEITLTAVPLHTKNIEWTVGGNFTLNRNKIIAIDPVGNNIVQRYLYPGKGLTTFEYFPGSNLSTDAYCKDYINVFVKGEPMDLFYAMPTDGLVKEGEVGVPFSDGKERGPGSVNYIDTNKDGMITEMDRVIVGDPNPDFTYGFNTELRIKNLTISAYFTGSYGNDVYNQQKAVLSDVTTQSANRLRASVFDSWTPTNQDAKYPALDKFNIADVGWCSDRFVEDGSYLRLSNLSVNYSIPFKDKKSLVRNITLGVSGKNLKCWTKYSGYDPDVNIYGSVWKYGVDMGAYPAARTIMMDFKITF